MMLPMDYTPWVEFLKLLSISGFNAQTTQEQAARVLTLRDSPIEMFDEDGDIYAVTSRLIEALKKLGWGDQGYKMYFCFYNDPLFGVDTFAYSTPFTRQIIQAARRNAGLNPAREICNWSNPCYPVSARSNNNTTGTRYAETIY